LDAGCIFAFGLAEGQDRRSKIVAGPGLPDFSGRNVPKLGKYTNLPLNYSMAIKYTKWP
jgi:hypothetical protein